MRPSFLRVPASFFILIVAASLAGTGCELEHTGGTAPQPLGPAPPPTPGPPAQIYGCGLPRGAGNGEDCPRDDARFEEPVRRAIEKTMAERPEFFQGGVNIDAYLAEVVENLRRAGFCAFNDGEEIAIKNSNDFSEQWDIISAGGNVIQLYTATCRPAWSAIPPAGDNS